MKPQQSESAGPDLPSAGLSACVLGLVLCPFGYIAIGALAGFAPAFSFLTLPPLLASAGFLLYRFLSRPVEGISSNLLMYTEVVSWIVVVAFLVVVSKFTLLTRFEQIGLFSTLFLGASLVSLPGVIMRGTALTQRLRRLPNAVTMLVLLAVLLMALATTTAYLLREPVFP